MHQQDMIQTQAIREKELEAQVHSELLAQLQSQLEKEVAKLRVRHPLRFCGLCETV
jgi:hypothetical protein